MAATAEYTVGVGGVPADKNTYGVGRHGPKLGRPVSTQTIKTKTKTVKLRANRYKTR